MRLLKRTPALIWCTSQDSLLGAGPGQLIARLSSSTASVPGSTSTPQPAQGATPAEQVDAKRPQEGEHSNNSSPLGRANESVDGAPVNETLPPLEPDEELLIKATGTSEKRLPRAVSTRERIFQREEELAKENGVITDYLEIGAGSSVFRQMKLKEMPTEQSRADRDPWPELDRKKDLPSYFKERRTSPFLPPTEAQDNKPDLLHDPKMDVPYPVYVKVLWFLLLVGFFLAVTGYESEPTG
jgi:hypothetical protein